MGVRRRGDENLQAGIKMCGNEYLAGGGGGGKMGGGGGPGGGGGGGCVPKGTGRTLCGWGNEYRTVW